MIASDRAYLAVLAAMPIILGVLAALVPSPHGLTGRANTDAESVLLILVIAACFIGAANSVRELVKERSIYTRERAAGLSAGAYLASKLIILAVISAVQAIVLVLIGLFGRKLPHTGALLTHLPLVEIVLAIGILAVVSMTLGLLISAMVNSSDKTMPLLVVGVMFQVILTGGIFPVAGKAGLEQIAWLSPSRWGFAAVASTVNLNVIQQPPGVKTGGSAGAKAAARPGPGPAMPATRSGPARAARPAGSGRDLGDGPGQARRGPGADRAGAADRSDLAAQARGLAEEHHPDADTRAGVHADRLVADRQDQTGSPAIAAAAAGPGLPGLRAARRQ